MKIRAKTSTRIDFAGGTLDLYPLYLFLGGGVTVNAGITLSSVVEIEERPDTQIHVRSLDLKREAVFDSIDNLNLEGDTSLIQRAVASFRPETGINVSTRNQAPKGSGLGASSSLLAALLAALARLKGEKYDNHTLIDRAAAIEAAHLGIPTGKQDYYGAVLGGVNALHFDERGCRPECLGKDPVFKKELESSLIISFTGISHYSGSNNWDMLKMAIDRQGSTYENLKAIKKISEHMRDAFLDKDLEKIGRTVAVEWQQRKQMAPGVTNDFINGVIKKAAEAGAWGSKLCGAGGGGCMITLTPSERMDAVASALTSSGVEVMDAEIDYKGLEIKEAVKAVLE